MANDMKDSAEYQRKSRMSNDQRVAESIDRRTKQLVEHHRAHGREISHDQARKEAVIIAERVERKKREGYYKK